MPPKADKKWNWCYEEVLLLISVWFNDVIQAEVEGCHWNQHNFQKISDELSKHGYERRWEKFRDKIKKLKQEYKELVDNATETRRKRKTFRFFLRRWMLCWVIDVQQSSLLLHHLGSHVLLCRVMRKAMRKRNYHERHHLLMMLLAL